MTFDLDTLDTLDMSGPGSADLDLDRFLSGADLDLDPADLLDPFAVDEDDEDDEDSLDYGA